MNKLTNVESQRVMAVMGDMLDRLNYLTYLPLHKNDELVELLYENRCNVNVDILKQQWQYEDMYLKLCSPHPATNEETNAPDGASSEDSESNNSNVKEEFFHKLIMNTRNLCRQLKENPIAMDIFLHRLEKPSSTRKEVQKNENSDLLGLVQILSELTDLTYSKLSKTVEDENAKREMMDNIQQRKKQAGEELMMLRERLSELHKTKDEEVSLLDIQVQKLKSELHAVNKTSAHELGLIEQEVKETLGKAYEIHSREMATHTDKILSLQGQHDKLTQEHREEEDLLRKKKCKTALEVAGIVEKYDKEIGTITSQIDELQHKYKQEQREYDELWEHFQKIDEEQARINAEEKILEEIRSRERTRIRILHQSATKIQKIFRGNLARKEFKKMSSKGKKGKGGKKGKKK